MSPQGWEVAESIAFMAFLAFCVWVNRRRGE